MLTAQQFSHIIYLNKRAKTTSFYQISPNKTTRMRGSAVIGREKEIKKLEKIYSSKKAELVAIYGRRRVGKTYLVDEGFDCRITFRHAGLSPMEAEPKEKAMAQKQHGFRWFRLMKAPINFMTDLALRRCIHTDI